MVPSPEAYLNGIRDASSIEEAAVYDTYGEAAIEGRPVGQGPDEGGWPKGDPDLGQPGRTCGRR